jgi:hypothetical protein
MCNSSNRFFFLPSFFLFSFPGGIKSPSTGDTKKRKQFRKATRCGRRSILTLTMTMAR